MPRRDTHSTHPQGFTLTELLVVIAIVAMLAALVSVAVVRALDTAKQTRIKTEVDMLDTAMKAYKEKYGSYPPCDMRGLANPRMRQHIAQAFPRYDMGANGANLIADLRQAGLDFTTFRPDQALVFFLRGFGPDPAHPFVTINDEQIAGGMNTGVKVARTQFFDFDQSRLQGVNGMTATDDPNMLPSYFPAGTPAGSNGAPYVYWDAASYGVSPPTMPPKPYRYFNIAGAPKGDRVTFGNAGMVTPYWFDSGMTPGTLEATEKWANPDSFQIISAGMDGKYGRTTQPTEGVDDLRLYPTGTNYDISTNLADDDNVTNFCNSARLGDAKP